MIGFGANRRGGRLPSFILIFLMVVIAILSFNYYAVSNRQGRLLDELAEVQSQVKRTDAARSRLEKRNSELMVQVDTHKKQIDQKDGDYSVLEGKLQAREALNKKCTDEKMKLQDDVTSQMTEIQRLKEQLTELKQELMKKEDQLREVKKNGTNLEKKLEYESLQCGRQIAQLKEEYEEAKKTLEAEAAKLRQVGMDENVLSGLKEAGRHVEVAAERHTVAAHRRGAPDLKEEMGKPGSDAGMPAIEDSEVGKLEENQFALKRPAITQKRHEAQDAVMGAGAGAADGLGAQSLSLDEPRLQQEGRAVAAAPPGVVQDEKAEVFEENNKVGIKADELGEQQRQLRAPEAKDVGDHAKVIPLPLNPAQVPNPLQPHHAKDLVPPEAVHHRQRRLTFGHVCRSNVASWTPQLQRRTKAQCSVAEAPGRFFDENESPVDPQHGSKLADYNGDDGNVGEYEADKQAELAYNEEEDGDGGEEDVQDDEDRDVQRERAVDYGKRHQAIDIL
ncbi:Protein CASC4 [Takifugu flavidus]|uniref:Protein GOLM2 n=1 Tax=Takifugu flavidus TaxID=433684 RepID=A0A5C6NLA6_9TELE|nr:Protein CASC4 [Takifugu flavidus]